MFRWCIPVHRIRRLHRPYCRVFILVYTASAIQPPTQANGEQMTIRTSIGFFSQIIKHSDLLSAAPICGPCPLPINFSVSVIEFLHLWTSVQLRVRISTRIGTDWRVARSPFGRNSPSSCPMKTRICCRCCRFFMRRRGGTGALSYAGHPSPTSASQLRVRIVRARLCIRRHPRYP